MKMDPHQQFNNPQVANTLPKPGEHLCRAMEGPITDDVQAVIDDQLADVREILEKHDPETDAKVKEILDGKLAGTQTLIPANIFTKLVARKSMAMFQRDIEQRNLLIGGGWGERGGLSGFVSTSGGGKSIVERQCALCFNRGVDCFGLHPVRPFKSWVIQCEDSEDRVARDRDDVIGYLQATHPQYDWQQAVDETMYLDFNGITGVDFVSTLDNELSCCEDGAKPDCVMINPFNVFFGGDENSARDCGGFLTGGMIGNRQTEGLLTVMKRHNVFGLLFFHTPKPPTTAELKDWLNNPYSAYKICGSSRITDALRSIIAFLNVPGTTAAAFTAGKNGNDLGWTDENGERATRQFYKWGDNGRHYWQPVPKEDWPELVHILESRSAWTRTAAKQETHTSKCVEMVVSICRKNGSPFPSKHQLEIAVSKRCNCAQNTAIKYVKQALEAQQIVEAETPGDVHKSKRIGTPEQFDETDEQWFQK